MTDRRDTRTLIIHSINSLSQLLDYGALPSEDTIIIEKTLNYLKQLQDKLPQNIAIIKNSHNVLDEVISHFKNLLEQAAIESKKLFITLLRLVLNIQNAAVYDSLGLPIKRGEAHAPQPLLGWNTTPPPFLRLLAAESISVVYVTGSFNCGHTLLALGPGKGYVHVNLLYGYPEYLTHQQFLDYLHDEGKELDAILPIVHPNMDMPSARKKLVELCSERWLWRGPWHNCFDFCKEVAEAGGADVTALNAHVPTNTLRNITLDAFSIEQSQQKITTPWVAKLSSSVPISSQHEFAKKLQEQVIQTAIDDYQGQPQQEKHMVDFIIENAVHVHQWQKPLQKDHIQLVQPHRKFNPDSDTARVIVETLVKKILTTDWQSGAKYQTIYQGQFLTRRLPRNMRKMIETYERLSLMGSDSRCNYLQILSQMQYTAYSAYRARNSWKSQLLRQEQTQAFYASFASFFQPKAEDVGSFELYTNNSLKISIN